MAQATSIAVPGQLLGPTSEFLPGPGTHIHNSKLYASILGPVTTTIPPKRPGPQKRLTKIIPVAPTPLPTIVVERDVSAASPTDGGAKPKREVLPEVNSTVLCRVTRITPKQAAVAILVVGETVLDGDWQGLIRVQDVRATEKDRVKIFESFRPGDIVRAVVVSSSCGDGRRVLTFFQISLGDQSNYYLSTASNNLGVIMATSEAGNAMYPVSWKEYKDPETGASENRKVAKPY
jgi:exosome complex component CSL4